MKSKIILMVLGLMLVLFAYSFSQVPQLINYQGKLTKSTGAPLDTTVQMIFSIYADLGGTTLVWTETQAAVKVEKGVFNVLLGSVNPISSLVFDGSVRYLGVKVGTDPEITPRKPMVSVPYAYRAGSLQTNCHDCDSIFVNVNGPDSVIASSGTAFLGKASGTSGASMYGIHGYANNTSTTGTGIAYGGYFETSSSGVGLHYGVSAEAFGSSPFATYGSFGYADNTSTGNAYGGLFATTYSGTGYHYGVAASGYGSSDFPVYGSLGYGYNTSTGTVYGGYFEAGSGGTGTEFGVHSTAAGSSSSPVYGCYSYGYNNSTGNAYGGLFGASSDGTGPHFGVLGEGHGFSSSSIFGVYGSGENTSTGSVYGGYFDASSAGTGTKYGVYASAPSPGYAGYFVGNTLATGTKTAAVKVNNGEYRLLYSQESPENWFEDFGGGALQNGVTTIQIDPLFTQTVNTQIEYRVFLTPEGNCKGLYVTNKTPSSFEVRELQDGTSNVTFSYRIVAKRKGYENTRLAKMGGPTPEEVALEQAKHQAEMEKERARMEEERLRQAGERKQMSEQQVKIDKEIR